MARVTQRGGDRPASMGQQRTREQEHQLPPRWGRKVWSKDGQNLSHGSGKGHEQPPEQEMALVSFYLTSRGVHACFFSPKMYKVELSAIACQARCYQIVEGT